jgi:hypothetical protein
MVQMALDITAISDRVCIREGEEKNQEGEVITNER